MSQVLSDKKNFSNKHKSSHNEQHKLIYLLERYAKLFTVYRRSNIEIAKAYLLGLLKCEKNHTNMERMVEAIPEQEYHQYHHFLSESKWDYAAVNRQTATDVCTFMNTCKTKNNRPIGFILDESSHLKKGIESVGVARQYAGVRGKVDNCQTSVYAALCNESNVCIINTSLFLPQSWINDTARCDKAGIPKSERIFKTKPQLALQLVKDAINQGITFDWIGGDGLYGHNTELTHGLDDEKLLYVLDVHKDELIYLEEPAFAIPDRKSAKGPTPTNKKANKQAVRIDKYCESLTESQWDKVYIRETTKGSKWVFAHTIQVWHWDGLEDAARCRTLVITKTVDKSPQIKYSFSNAAVSSYTRAEYAYFQCNRYWVERGFDDSKNELGLSGYQVRKWIAWQHHQSLVMMAALYMMQVKNEQKQEYPLMSIRDARIMVVAQLFSDKKTIKLLHDQMIIRHKKRQMDIDRYSKTD
jgi:SRSO17 transposase